MFLTRGGKNLRGGKNSRDLVDVADLTGKPDQFGRDKFWIFLDFLLHYFVDFSKLA